MIFDPSGSWLISFSAALFIGCSYLLISFIAGHSDTPRHNRDTYETTNPPTSTGATTLPLMRWFGDCVLILLAILFTRTFNWFTSTGRLPDDPSAVSPTPPVPSIPVNPTTTASITPVAQEDASAAMLRPIVTLLEAHHTS